MSQKLLDLYRAVLSTGNLVADAQGYISARIAGDEGAATLAGKRLVLPTREQLQSPDRSERVIFHPLNENIVRGVESDVVAYFRRAVNAKINLAAHTVALNLLQIAASPADHGKLTPEQQEFLSVVKNATEKTHTSMMRLQEAVPLNEPQRNIAALYLKRGGLIGTRKYSALGVVNFPLYKELQRAKERDSLEVFDIKLERKMDRDTLMSLLEYIFPRINEAEAYLVGSDSRVAPFMDALMATVRLLAAPLNDILRLFENVFPDAQELMFDDSWVDDFENLENLRRDITAIPMQAGNEGSHLGQQPAPAAAAPAAATPTFAGNAPAAAPAQPVMVNVPPGYQLVPAPAAPPQIQKSANGVNFQSVLAANPALAYQVGAGFGSQPFQTAMSAPMQRMPSWSAPGALGPMTGPAYGQPTYGQPVANYGQQPMQGGYNMPYNRGPFGGT